MYDESGRLESSTLESEWDDTEREWMRSLAWYRANERCPLCGMPKSVCRDIERDGRVGVEVERCHVTAAIAARQQADHQAEIRLPQSLSYAAKF